MRFRIPGVAAATLASFLALNAHAADAALIEAAKREGGVTWYTAQIINEFAAPAAAAFEKKYGVKVNYVRAESNEIVLRITTEAKAGRVQADVFDGTNVSTMVR